MAEDVQAGNAHPMNLLPAQAWECPDKLASEMGPDEVMAYTQNVRKHVVEQIVGGGKFPTEAADKSLLLSALKDMDAQEINKKRLVIEQKGADNDAAFVAGVLRHIDPKTAFRAAQPGEGQIVDAASRVLPASVPDPVVLPGEGDVNPGQMDYQSFMISQGSDPAELGKNDGGKPAASTNENGAEQDNWPGMEIY